MNQSVRAISFCILSTASFNSYYTLLYNIIWSTDGIKKQTKDVKNWQRRDKWSNWVREENWTLANGQDVLNLLYSYVETGINRLKAIHSIFKSLSSNTTGDCCRAMMRPACFTTQFSTSAPVCVLFRRHLQVGIINGDFYKEFLQMLFWWEPCIMILNQRPDGKRYAIALHVFLL